MNERIIKILDLLTDNKTIKISLLAELLGVSQVTMRKDLDYLEERKIICCTHGNASLDGADTQGKRIAFYHSIKRQIAKAAAQIIEEGETILLESGSCCTLFAEELAITGKKVTIITNSLYLANYLCKLPNIKIILLGGAYQPDSQIMVGPITIKCAEYFFTEKIFLGTDGFFNEYGFTDRDYMRAETAAALAERAKEVFILTEAAKFRCRGYYNLIQFNKLTGVFTDESIPKEAETTLVKNNVRLYKVPVNEEKVKWRRFPGLPPVTYSD